MTLKITALKAICVIRKVKTRCKVVTDITIGIPNTGIVVARATKAGNFTEEAALAEFHRFPAKFNIVEQGHNTAKAMKLVA